MTRTIPLSLRKRFVGLLLAGATAGGWAAHAQSAGNALMANAPSSPPAPAALPEAPTAPVAGLASGVKAQPDQPLLPRNFRITPASGRSNKPSKVRYYVSSTYSPRNLAEALLIGGVPNLSSAPSQPDAPANFSTATSQQYETAMEAYGVQMDTWRRDNQEVLRYHAHRLETGLATVESRDLLSNLVLPMALHQQARYIPAPVNSDFGERMANAAESIVVTRNDAGALVPNYSKLGGTVAAAFLGKTLFASAFNAPELDSNHFVTRYIGYSLLGDLATNTAHELVRAALEPDMTYYNLHGRSSEDAYYPLSLGGKVVYWMRSTYALRNFVEGALIAGVPQIGTEPVEPNPGIITTYQQATEYDALYEQYGTEVQTWRRSLENSVRYHEHRFIGGFAESESQMFLQNLAVPVLFNMDPRYVPLGASYSASQRLGHAFEGLVVTHTDAGEKTVNLPVLVGTVGAAYAAKELYYPQLGTPRLESNGVLAKTIGLNLVADGLYNVIGEFFRHRGY